MTDVRLVKDCGLYPSYKRIIDFTGTKSEIIQKQLHWIDSFNPLVIRNVNYNKVQNALSLPLDYFDAQQYTYAVLTDLSGSDYDKPIFMFIGGASNLSNGDNDTEPLVSLSLSLDPIMTYMGEYELDECMVNREHTDRWNAESSSPIRLTPNVEGVTAFIKSKSAMKLETDIESNIGLCVLSFTSPYIKTSMKFKNSSSIGEVQSELKDSIYCGAFLVDMSNFDRKIDTIVSGHYIGSVYEEFTNYWGEGQFKVKFPSLNEVISGEFQSKLPIVDNAIVSFTIAPACYIDITKHTEGGIDYYIIGDMPIQNILNEKPRVLDPTSTINKLSWMVADNNYEEIEIGWNGSEAHTITDSNIDGRTVIFYKNLTDIESDYYQITIPSDIWRTPEKPTDESISSSIYEPALYMQPYTSRKIVKGDGTTILDIPDVDYFDNLITLRTIITANGVSTVFVHGNEDIGNYAEGEIAIDNSALLDVVNDQWKEYLYTKRDTDRQMVSNYAWKNAIDNLIYMSYGGALVGSRSAGEEGYLAKGYGGYSQVRYYDGGGTGAYASERGRTIYPRGQKPGSLTSTGHRVLGAIGLAAGASIVTSLVDAHTMWANQMQQEKQIRNEPTSVLNIGDGVETILSGYKDYYFVSQTVDDINYDRAYENFKKYGYLINKFEKPNTQSRKYFNYLLTNGAIVKGSINQGIRDVIASIYDAGVTIFHYDSGDTTTRKLEYTDKENIEVSLL